MLSAATAAPRLQTSWSLAFRAPLFLYCFPLGTLAVAGPRAASFLHKEALLSGDGRVLVRNIREDADDLAALAGEGMALSGEPHGVPRVIHQTFKTHIQGKFPNPVWQMAEESWKKYFPEGNGTDQYQYVQWSDDEILSFFTQNCEPEVGPLPAYSNNISVSDLARYCILWKRGGIYADLDYEPRANFHERLAPDRVSLVQSPYKGETFQNSLMSSPPGMPYWLDVLSQAMLRHHSPAGDANEMTGPRLLETLPATHDPEVIRMLPCREFQRATHTGGMDATKNCGMLNLSNAKEVLGIHWGTWSWVQVESVGKGHDASAETSRLFAQLFGELHPHVS